MNRLAIAIVIASIWDAPRGLNATDAPLRFIRRPESIASIRIAP
jgi:hypothetical protein